MNTEKTNEMTSNDILHKADWHRAIRFEPDDGRRWVRIVVPSEDDKVFFVLKILPNGYSFKIWEGDMMTTINSWKPIVLRPARIVDAEYFSSIVKRLRLPIENVNCEFLINHPYIEADPSIIHMSRKYLGELDERE